MAAARVAPADLIRADRRLRDVLAAHLTADGACFGSASWLVTARAR